MRRGEFEEIFEECLSALLEGRRSVDECLSLYPAWRGRLEPLLRTAQETAAGLDQSPPHHIRERGLYRFLEAARVKRRLREVFPQPATTSPRWRWAPAAAAALVVVGAVAFMTATPSAEDGPILPGQVSIAPYTPEPQATPSPPPPQSPLERVQAEMAVLEDAVREGAAVDVGLLQEIEEASTDLAADLENPAEIELIERVAAVSAASRQYDLLQTVQEGSFGRRARAVEASLRATHDVLEMLGATPTPEPSPSPEPTPLPTVTPTPQPSATPAGEPSPSSWTTPAPSQ